jgi:hypothetical protein
MLDKKTVKDAILDARDTLKNRRIVTLELFLIGIFTFSYLLALNLNGIIQISPAIAIPIFIIFLVLLRIPKVYKIYSILVSIVWGIVATFIVSISELPSLLEIPFNILMFIVGFFVSMNIHKNI